MEKRFAVIALFLLLAFASTEAGAYNQYGSYTLTLFSDPSFCVDYSCDGCIPPIRFPIADFPDGMLSFAKLRSVSVIWETGNDYQGFSWQNIPTVALDLNGTPIDTQTVVNFIGCDLSLPPSTYVFQSPDYQTGFPGYVRNGVNTLYLTMETESSSVSRGIATINLNYELPPPFDFNVTDQAPESDRRVLLSNWEPGYPYPYFQSIGGGDSRVPMFVRARSGSTAQYQSGLTVYLRVVDPADPSPYANPPYSTFAHTLDNQGPPAKLDGQDLTPYPNAVNVWQATTNGSGQVNFDLVLGVGTAAGDNYQVEASFDPNFAPPQSGKSGTLTAWKRVFLEKRNELRNGITLAATAPAGASVIHITGNHYQGSQGNHRISRGDRIVLVHAPALDRSNVLDGWYKEEHDVADVSQDANGGYAVTLGTGNGKTITPQHLLHEFGPDPSDAAPELADWIAKVSGAALSSSDYFDVSNDLVTGSGSPFPAAFTEYVVLPDGAFGFIPLPHFGATDQKILQRFVEKWSFTGAGTAAAPNHQLLAIGDDDGSQFSDAGVTVTQVSGQTSSWVWRGAIDANVKGNGSNAGANADLWAAKTSAHELAHEWSPNWPFILNDHCPADTPVYDDPQLLCLLANSDATAQAQRTNGVARFHMLSLGAGVWHSEYLEIRKFPDPFVP